MKGSRAGEKAQGLSVLAALLENLSLFPRTHTASHSHLIQCPLPAFSGTRHARGTQAHT